MESPSKVAENLALAAAATTKEPGLTDIPTRSCMVSAALSDLTLSATSAATGTQTDMHTFPLHRSHCAA